MKLNLIFPKFYVNYQFDYKTIATEKLDKFNGLILFVIKMLKDNVDNQFENVFNLMKNEIGFIDKFDDFFVGILSKIIDLKMIIVNNDSNYEIKNLIFLDIEIDKNIDKNIKLAKPYGFKSNSEKKLKIFFKYNPFDSENLSIKNISNDVNNQAELIQNNIDIFNNDHENVCNITNLIVKKYIDDKYSSDDYEAIIEEPSFTSNKVFLSQDYFKLNFDFDINELINTKMLTLKTNNIVENNYLNIYWNNINVTKIIFEKLSSINNKFDFLPENMISKINIIDHQNEFDKILELKKINLCDNNILIENQNIFDVFKLNIDLKWNETKILYQILVKIKSDLDLKNLLFKNFYNGNFKIFNNKVWFINKDLFSEVFLDWLNKCNDYSFLSNISTEDVLTNIKHIIKKDIFDKFNYEKLSSYINSENHIIKNLIFDCIKEMIKNKNDYFYNENLKNIYIESSEDLIKMLELLNLDYNNHLFSYFNHSLEEIFISNQKEINSIKERFENKPNELILKEDILNQMNKIKDRIEIYPKHIYEKNINDLKVINNKINDTERKFLIDQILSKSQEIRFKKEKIKKENRIDEYYNFLKKHDLDSIQKEFINIFAHQELHDKLKTYSLDKLKEMDLKSQRFIDIVEKEWK